MTDWSICIDFGTAYSKAAAAPVGAWSRFDPRLVRPLMLGGNADGDAFLLDSAIFVDDDRVLFGKPAIARAEALASKKRVALRSFKTLLSVADLDRALNTAAARSIDLARQFKMRDLIVLYLAYLLAAIDRAAKADPVLGRMKAALRYAAPAWGEASAMHRVITRLFGEAEAFRAVVGEQLLAPGGLVKTAVEAALPKAMSGARPLEMGLIFEATAAAAYTSIGLQEKASHVIVVDMGAGTTDITALARADSRMAELMHARSTLNQAGDFIDRIIANRVIASDRRARSIEEQSRLWTVLMRQMRDLKETLFAEGAVKVRHDGRVLDFSMRELERDRDFRQFNKTLTEVYDRGIAAIRASGADRRAAVLAVAVGGGASAPFIQALLKRGASRNLPVSALPATPQWAHAPEFQGNLAPVFPQLAIAIGGALAPDSMLAARGVSSQPVARTDTQPARD